MSDQITRTATYTTDVIEDQAMCELWPTVHVNLIETITTRTVHADDSVTTHKTRPRVVQSWSHKHEEKS